MTPLTLEHAIENKFTGIDCVRYFNKDYTDEFCDYFIWNETCYPLDMEKTIEQLNKALLK